MSFHLNSSNSRLLTIERFYGNSESIVRQLYDAHIFGFGSNCFQFTHRFIEFREMTFHVSDSIIYFTVINFLCSNSCPATLLHSKIDCTVSKISFDVVL